MAMCRCCSCRLVTAKRLQAQLRSTCSQKTRYTHTQTHAQPTTHPTNTHTQQPPARSALAMAAHNHTRQRAPAARCTWPACACGAASRQHSTRVDAAATGHCLLCTNGQAPPHNTAASASQPCTRQASVAAIPQHTQMHARTRTLHNRQPPAGGTSILANPLHTCRRVP